MQRRKLFLNHLIIAGVGFILFLAVGFTYVGTRLFSWLRFLFPRMNKIAYIIVYVIYIFIPTIGMFVPAWLWFVRWLGMCLLAFFVYHFAFQVILDSIIFFRRLINKLLSEAFRFRLGGAALLLALAVSVGGFIHARNISHVHYDIWVDGEGLSAPVTIVMLSDLHFGGFNSERRLTYWVERINALEPDIVCIPGHIFDGGFRHIRDPDLIAERLRGIEATYGVFAALGNHDAGNDFYLKMDVLERGGVRVLREEYVYIADRIVLVGRDDVMPMGHAGDVARGNITDIIAGIGEDKVIIVMDHNPAGIAEHDGYVDLLLCGHTHRGQLFPINFVTRAMFIQHYGYHRTAQSRTQVVVSSGINTWGPPIRVGTSNEIVSITLR